MKKAKPVFDDAQATFWRTLQTFAFTRTFIVVVLLVYFGLNAGKLWPEKQQFWQICITYLIVALTFVLLSLYWRRRFMMQLVLQISVDIGAISFLYLSAGGIKSGLAILYLFPLAGGAVLAPLILSLFFVSVVTLILLADSGYQLLNENADVSSSHVGLYGAAFFISIFAINRLAARLIKQESLALGRGKALHVQQAVNRLIIADMEDGVLVVDRKGRMLISNPAAVRMLGLTFPHEKSFGKLSDTAWLQPISDAYQTWNKQNDLRTPTLSSSPTFVLVKQGEELSLQDGTTVFGSRRELVTHLKLRFVKVDAEGVQEERNVIFLQDVTEIENRAQQLKLASMGRLTASIAHEVRNPLSAIGHAASLLSEDDPDASQLRLLTIISDNVARLNRMIEDILKLSRKAHQTYEPLCLGVLFEDVMSELQEIYSVQQGMVTISDMTSYKVRFDPLHLREIVLNLLTNALRYASGMPGSIRIYMVPGIGHRLELHMQDDGPQITAEVRAHLFEPFYTTSSKGTGLGLYLARELCLNNGALLNYEYRSDDEQGVPTGRFVITFANNEKI